VIETILNLPQPVITGLLLLSLIAVFVVASKVMEMIFESITIALMSGVFYVGLTYLFGGVEFAFNDLLLYSVLGPSVYMLYSFLSTVLSTTSKIVQIPLTVIRSIYRFTKKFFRKLRKLIRSYREEEITERNKSTKEVVLNSD